MPMIRTAARALILEQDHLLAIRMRDRSGVFHILPGGGQRHWETLPEALRRECLEEIGARIEVGELLYTREYIGKNHEFHTAHRGFHQLEAVFRCTLPQGGNFAPATETDKKQIGVSWLPVAELARIRFLPEAIKPFFRSGDFTPDRTYLGDIN